MELSREEVLGILGAPRQAAQTRAATTMEDDPDEAARSLSLSRETGVPSGIINADSENFDRMYRGRLSSEIIGAAPKLQSYINQDPLHAKISNDDWGAMLELGLKLDDHDTVANRNWFRVVNAGIARGIREGGGSALQGVGYLTGLGELRNIGRKLHEATEAEVPMLESEQASIWGKIGSTLGGIVALIPSGAVGGMPGAAVQMGLAGGAEQVQRAEAKGAPTATPFTAGFATGGAIGAAAPALLGLPKGAIAKMLTSTGGFALLGEAQEAVDQFIARTLYDPAAEYKPDVSRMAASAFVGGLFGGGAALFTRHGENPPPGIDPKVDRLHEEQAKEAADKFADVRKALASTNTAQRSPEAMERYLAQYPAKTWITSEALQKIYGDKAPEPGDGKLGDIPGVVEGYPAAMVSGGELVVDRAALLTKAKPELLDEVEDDLIHTFNGVSKNQAAEAPTVPKPTDIESDYIEKIGTGEHGVPTVEELANLASAIDRADQLQAGLSDQDMAQLKRLNRRIDRGDDAAIAEKNKLLEKVPANLPELNLPDAETVRQLRREYEVLEKQVDESDTEYVDGIARVLKRYIVAYTDGDGFARAVFRKAFVEAQEHGIDTKKLGDDIINRFLSGLSPSDQAFMRSEFAKLGRSKITGPVETALDAVKQSAGLRSLGAAAAPRTTEGMVAEALTNKQLKLLDAAEAESKAEEAFLRKQNEAMVRRRQTKEWNDKADQIRPEVQAQVAQRADVSVDDFMRTGRIGGRRIERRLPRLDEQYIPEELKGQIDAGFIGKKGRGYNPDDLAPIFGYANGEAMLHDMAEAEAVRRQHGLGPDAWRSAIVKAEIEARLENELGPLEGNILDEARQFVVSPTVIERLWAEIENQFDGDLGSHDSFKAAVQAVFDEAPPGQHSVIGYLKAAGKYARQVESGLLDEKPAETLAAKMAQLRAIQMANLAVKVERAKAQFEREMRLNSDRTRVDYPQEYMNFIHEIMGKVGRSVNRPPGEVQAEIAKGDHKSLEKFVEYKIDKEKRSMPVWPELFDPSFKADPATMKTSDFLALNDSIRTILHNARAEGKEIVQGREIERLEVEDEAVGAVEKLPQVKVFYNADGTGKVRRWFQGPHVGLITAGSLANRIHRGLGGVLSRIMGDFHDADYSKKAMDLEYARMIQAIDHGDLNKPLENGPFKGPGGKGFVSMTREKLIKVIIYMGTKSSREAMIKGEAQNAGMNEMDFATQLGMWINRVAEPEDFKIAQAWVDMFEHFNTKYGDPMERRQSGIGVEKVPADSPFGNYKGGYAPLDYDSTRLKETERGKGPVALPPKRAATPRGYTIKRTGYFAPVDLSIDSMRAGLSEMIHDAAYREVVAEAGKLFYSNRFKNAMTNHMGVLYRNMLTDFIESKAAPTGPDSRNGKLGTQLSSLLRTNIVTSLISFNPGTVAKHFSTAASNSLFEVGLPRFARAVFDMTNPETAVANAKFMFESSKFMAGRRRALVDSVGGATDEALNGMSWNGLLAHIGTSPVAFSDMVTAGPTWLAAFGKEAERLLATGETDVHNQAVRYADEAVRRAHGDPMDKPAYMRGRNELGKWTTALYVFFNHIFQRHYEMAWRSADAARAAWAGDLKGAMQDIPKLTALFISNLLIPAAVEEMVTPYTTKDKESWGHKAAHLMGMGLANAVPLVRDLWHGITTGSDSFGLLGTEAHNLLSAGREIYAHGVSAKNAGKLAQETAALGGVLIGFPVQFGRTAKFLINYKQGKEHPEGIIQFPWESRRHRSFLGGMWRGTADYPTPRR